MTVKRFQNALPLKVFVHRQKVIRLFRSLIQCAMKIESTQLRQDMMGQIRADFAKHRHVADDMTRRNLITEGQRQLEVLESMVSKSNNTTSVETKEVGKGWPWEK